MRKNLKAEAKKKIDLGTIGLDLLIVRTMASHTAGRPTKNDFWLKSAERRDIEFATN